jgi:hypothetical protein
LLFAVRLKRNGRRSKSTRIGGGNIVLIQDPTGSDMARESLVDLGALFSQLRYGMDRDGTPPLSSEKVHEGFLAGLFGHKTGVVVVLSRLMFFGNIEVVLGLAEPAQPGFRTWLHRRACLLGGLAR